MQLFKQDFSSMGCPCSVSLYAKDEYVARDVFKAIYVEVDRLDQYYTNYSSESFLAKMNKTAGDKRGIIVDSETAILLDYAAACYEMSDGLFDVTAGALRRAWNFDTTTPSLPSREHVSSLLQVVGWDKVIWRKPHLVLPYAGMMIDFGGVVKEYAADAAERVCKISGIYHAMIEMGGDIKVVGPHIDGRPWRIGVSHPRDNETSIAYIELSEGGIATSGDFERSIIVDGVLYAHILNPQTGMPVRGMSGITAAADHCLVAGSLTTIAFLKGPDNGRKWLEKMGAPYLCADDQGRILGTKGFTKILAPQRQAS